MTNYCYPLTWRVFSRSPHPANSPNSSISAKQPLLPTKSAPNLENRVLHARLPIEANPHALLKKHLTPSPWQYLKSFAKWRNSQPISMQVLASMGLGIIDSAFMMLINSMQKDADSLSVVIIALVNMLEELSRLWGRTQADSQRSKLDNPHPDIASLSNKNKKTFFSRQIFNYTILIDLSSIAVLIGVSYYHAGGLHGIITTFTLVKTALAYSQARQIGFLQLLQKYFDEKVSQEQEAADNPCLEELEQNMQRLITYLVNFLLYICASSQSFISISVQEYSMGALIVGAGITVGAKLQLLPLTSDTQQSTTPSSIETDDKSNP